ncbi:MAG: cytidine deaminase [Clostridia bacterium]
MKQDDLINIAKNACKNACSPSTGYMVGAALLSKSGTVYIGVNVEDEKIPNLSICAERNAIQNAISHGDREFEAIAVVGKRKDSKDFDNTLTPCGICLQYIIDMCRDIDIICYINGMEVVRKVDYFLNTPFDLAEK